MSTPSSALPRVPLKVSAGNQLHGHVVTVERGAVNAEVLIDIGGGGSMVAIVTDESIDALSLRPGREVYALVQASSVIFTTERMPFVSARNALWGVIDAVRSGGRAPRTRCGYAENPAAPHRPWQRSRAAALAAADLCSDGRLRAKAV